MSTNYGFEPTLDGLNNIDADTSTTTNIICDTIQINVSGTAPTRSPADNSTHISTTAYVDAAVSAVGAVSLSGNNVFTGFNSYNTNLPTSTLLATSGDELVNKTFVDSEITTATNNLLAATNVWTGTSNTFNNAIVATQIEGPTNTNITVEGKGTGDVILKTGSTNRITCDDSGAITIAGSSGQPMNITTTGIMTLQSATSTAINIANNQTSGELNLGTGSTRTGTINIGTGADGISAKTINIGNNTGAVGALNLKTRTITVGGSNCVSISADGTTNSIQGTTVNIKTTGTGGTLNMGTAMTSGSIDIGTAASSSTTFNIGTGSGSKIMNLGGSATTLNLVGSSITCNTVLPTSTLTPTLGTELVTKTFTDAAITTAATAYAKLGAANAFTSTNTFNSFLPTSTISATTANELVNKTTLDSAITTAAIAYAKLGAANAFTSTNTFNSFLPTSTISATTSNELVNKTTLDAAITTAATAYVTLAGTQTISGNKTYIGSNTFLSLEASLITNTGSIDTPNIGSGLATDPISIVPSQSSGTCNIATLATRSGPINLGTGASAKTVTIGGTSTTANINSLTTTISTSTLTGVGITHSSAATSADNMRLTATGGYLARLGEGSVSAGLTLLGIDSGTSIIKATTSALQIRADAGMTLTGTVTANGPFQATTTGSNISLFCEASRTGQININTGASASSTTTIGGALAFNNLVGTTTFTGATTTTGTATFSNGFVSNLASYMSGDLYISQATYPSVVTTQLGYTITKTFATTVLSDTTGTFSMVGSGQALGSDKGVYVITCGFELTNSGSDTVNNKALCLSLTTASGTPVNAFGAWEYYEEINDSMGSAGARYKGTLCGTYIKTSTAAATLFLNGYANTSGSQTISCIGNCSITRIG